MEHRDFDLVQIFKNCAWNIEYKQAGDSVNYAFIETLDELFIYFQGSNSITDWVRNFLFKKRPYKDMEKPYKVHRGFLAAWKEVEDIVINKVKDPKWKHITVIGYSHGAALAGFCHECVWYHRPDLRENGLHGFAFEAPRFYGGFKVRKDLRERWTTFTVIRTNNDLVTHCPPAIFGFCHVGGMMKIKGDVSLVKKKWIPKCIKSHYPEVVVDALEKAKTPKE